MPVEDFRVWELRDQCLSTFTLDEASKQGFTTAIGSFGLFKASKASGMPRCCLISQIASSAFAGL